MQKKHKYIDIFQSQSPRTNKAIRKFGEGETGPFQRNVGASFKDSLYQSTLRRMRTLNRDTAKVCANKHDPAVVATPIASYRLHPLRPPSVSFLFH